MRRNIRTSLRRRGRGDAMARYDRLPEELRQWLAFAALPWSAQSALRIWQAAMAERPCPRHALDRLAAAEARLLARDAPRIWGGDHPARRG
ncbi:DUF6525 family protein [Falsirhodobacter deserti]|uniref:DUF6525 family protein n=1 Tax=Falsirhodobacter deserti TaxID=1365611 RepID=UPI000FE2B73D|nr:DUF6525 family protein [Falsirhodobacter deserti]